MRWRLTLWVSVGLNVALAAGWYLAVRQPAQSPTPAAAPAESATSAAATVVRTNVVVRRQNLTWDMIESEDYPTYIANLRAIGCPESTIRDIIVADVTELFVERRAKEVTVPAHQWWRSDPDPEVAKAAQAKLEALEKERRDLLTRLLGPRWDVEAERAAKEELAAVEWILSGPHLGDLPAVTKQTVLDIIEGAQRRYEEQFADKEPDPAAVARLRKETRDQLARVLTAEQLEEYLLRYSETAHTLREQLRGLDLSPEEFRRVFRLADPLDLELQVNLAGDAPAAARRRKELEQQREAALERELGPERARVYRLNQDPLFQQARLTIQQLGGEAEAVLPLYQIYQEIERETRRIQNDPSLSEDEREEQIHLLKLDQERSVQGLQQAFKRAQQQAGTTPPQGTP